MAGKGKPKTGGRQKGTPNKINMLLRESILRAAEEAGNDLIPNGGIAAYLKMQAGLNPSAFMNIRKVLPTQMTGDPEAPIHVKGSNEGFSALAEAMGQLAAAKQTGTGDAGVLDQASEAVSTDASGKVDDVVDSGGERVGEDPDWGAGLSVVRPN